MNQPIEEALDELSPGWRERRAKRKSLWNILNMLLACVFTLVVWYVLVQAVWRLHLLFHPEHVATENGLHRLFENVGGGERPSSNNPDHNTSFPGFLLLFAPGVPALIAGGLLSNCAMWCILPARRAFEIEAKGDVEMTFRGANSTLIRKSWILAAVCLVLAIIGAFALRQF
jgi:hypothetical protein